MQVTRRPLFESDAIRLDFFEVRPVSDQCGDVERQSSNVVVLPLAGVFAKHAAPGRSVLGTPSHAVFIAADAPYRLSFPGCIGDRALIVRFDDALVPEGLDARGGREGLAPHGLLAAPTMMLRNLLWARLKRGGVDTLEIETLGLEVLARSLSAMRIDGPVARRSSTAARRARAVERVKEAVALAPAEKWSVAKLARVANLSPFHLCRVFRQTVGVSLYDYVLHARLAQSLDPVLDGGSDLTAVALDAGFASHSHFSARFRRLFGCTPVALRRVASARQVAELRKIVTAPRSHAAVN